jgi:hypothetical protein
LITALVAIVRIAYAAQPPNVVASDVSGNTAMGTDALLNLSSGGGNTASGGAALYSNTTGTFNTASGYGALYSNTTGIENTATGFDALFYNTTGYFNTADGLYALIHNTTGFDNTATGHAALFTTPRATRIPQEVSMRSLAIRRDATTSLSVKPRYRKRDRSEHIAIGWHAGRRTDGNDNISLAHKGARITNDAARRQLMRASRSGITRPTSPESRESPRFGGLAGLG